MTLINITTTLPTSTQTSSIGAWQGDNPLNHAFPLLIIQTTIVIIITRFLAFLLKPLRQPKVIAEILGGILLGPSALGRNEAYLSTIFPTWSTRILESVASIGLLFFLFLVGLELDLTTIRGSGRRAFGIAVVGISLPFICGIGITFLLRKTVEGAQDVGYSQFLVFIGVALSITAFPVLARILAELKLLTTQVGETALAAAAFNDVVAWVLLALAVALAGKGTGGGDGHTNPLVSIWILGSGIAFVVFMLVMVRPAMNWVSKRCLSGNKPVHEGYICLTLAGVMLSGLTTDLIGIHAIFGSFVFGLMIPKEGEFAGKLIERIEDFVSGLLLPLYFASSGLNTNVGKIHGLEAWGLLVLVIATACAGKILGTFVVAMLHKIPPRESLTLGVLMNTKGLVELIVLNIGKEKKVLNDEIFAILILMALFTTFMTTPTVIAIYRPARVISSHTHRRLQRESMMIEAAKELRILACVYGPGNVPSLVKLIESTRCTKKFQLKLYTMHLVELTERSSSILMARRARKNGHPSRDRSVGGEIQGRVAIAFETNSQLGRVKVRPMTAISALPTMHEDICHVAEEKRVTMVILPFHKQGIDEGDVAMEDMGPGWRGVNPRVLRDAPCSVAVLVDRFLGSGAHRVCLLFFGGPDDREALELVERMVQHPGVRVTVVRFVEREETEGDGVMLRRTLESTEISCSSSTAVMDREGEKELDEAMLSEFRRKWDKANYEEIVDSNILEKVLEIGRSEEYELIVVGKGRFPYRVMGEQADNRAAAEHPELGPVGDILASSTNGVVSSVLVVQQYDSSVHANDDAARISNIVDGDDTINNTCTTTTTPSV